VRDERLGRGKSRGGGTEQLAHVTIDAGIELVDGDDGVLQDFRAGAFKLAVEAGCPVIPVAVSGTYAGLPKHGIMLRNRMHALVRVLEPLHPAEHGNDAQRLLKAAHAAIGAVLPVEAQPRG
jgi:1-acyl-sn-glycerol-3-phosphate acyltransferase